MDFAGLLEGHAGVSEALALPVFEMVTFGCGGSATLPSFSPLSFLAGICGGAVLFSRQEPRAQFSAGDAGHAGHD